MTHIEIASMPVAEKISLMESLWDSLSTENMSAAVVPEWHNDVLASRRDLLDRGLDPLSTLEDAKQRIRDLIDRQ